MDTRLLSIFYNKFLSRQSKDFEGLKYTTKLNDDGIIIFNFTNPNNLSVNTNVLWSHVEEIAYDFGKFIPDFNNYSDPFFKQILERVKIEYEDINIEQRRGFIYLNPEDVEKFNRIAKSLNIFKYGDFWSPCTTIFVDLDNEGREGVRIELSIKLLHPEYKGEPISNSDLEKLMRDLYEDDNFFDYIQYGYPDSLHNEIWHNPLLLDNEFMYTTATVTLFDKNGEEIEH